MDSKLQKAWPARLLAHLSYQLSPLPDDENEAARRELAAVLRGLTPEDPSGQAQARSRQRMLTLLAERQEQRRPPFRPLAWSRPMAAGVAVAALAVASLTGASAMSGVTPMEVIRVLLEVTPLAQGSGNDGPRQMTPTGTATPSQPEQPDVIDMCEATPACIDRAAEATGIQSETPAAKDASEKPGQTPKSNGTAIDEGQSAETNDRDQTPPTNQAGASIDPDTPESGVTILPPPSEASGTADTGSADESQQPAASTGNNGNGPDGNGPPGQTGEKPGNGPDGNGPPGQTGEKPGNGPDGNGPPGQTGEKPGNGPDGNGPPGQSGEKPGNGPDGNGPPGSSDDPPGNGPSSNSPPGQSEDKPGQK